MRTRHGTKDTGFSNQNRTNGLQSPRSRWWITHISNKNLKYCPAFPDRFGSIEDAQAFCELGPSEWCMRG